MSRHALLHSRKSRAALGMIVALVFAITLFAQMALAGPEAPFGVHLPLLVGGTGDSNNPTPTPPPSTPTPGTTSDELIDAAVDSGAIDPETGLVYRVYAAFNDDRLPAAYRGDDSLVVDSHILAEVQAQWDALLPESKSILAPFLTPPIYGGSWYDLRQQAAATGKDVAALARPDAAWPICSDLEQAGWASDEGRTAPIKVWWPANELAYSDIARSFIQAMDGQIWPKLTGLMGQPLSDDGVACGGDDGKLDIYLVGGASSMAPPLDPGCKHTPAYIVMNAGRSVNILAHEFMHTIQFGFNTSASCVYPGDYAWLVEATAQWAMDYVYPTSNEEHYTADWYLNGPDKTLSLTDNKREYGAYLLPQMIAHTVGNNAIRTIWDNATSMGSLQAVDKVLPGGFAQTWQQFARYAWNTAPYDLFKQWDGLTTTVKRTSGTVTMGSPLMDYYAGPESLPALSSTYHRFVFTDPNARSAVFYNGLAFNVSRKAVSELSGGQAYVAEAVSNDQKKGAMVQALIKINGEWRREDWTDKGTVAFCLDKKDERLEELVIINSNTAFEPAGYELRAAGERPTLLVTNIGCWQWEGTMDATQVWEDGQTWTINASDLLFEQYTPPNATAAPGLGYAYKLTQGTIDWRIEGGSCNAFGSGTYNPLEPGAQAIITTFNGALSGTVYRKMAAAIWQSPTWQVTYRECDNDVTTGWAYNWGAMNAQQQGLKQDGTLDTTFTLPVDGSPQWTWHLKPKRQE